MKQAPVAASTGCRAETQRVASTLTPFVPRVHQWISRGQRTGAADTITDERKYSSWQALSDRLVG